MTDDFKNGLKAGLEEALVLIESLDDFGKEIQKRVDEWAERMMTKYPGICKEPGREDGPDHH